MIRAGAFAPARFFAILMRVLACFKVVCAGCIFTFPDAWTRPGTAYSSLVGAFPAIKDALMASCGAIWAVFCTLNKTVFS